jgi:hypothetical protein
MQPTSSHEYRIAPELQRCCWYVIFGALTIGAIAYWLMQVLPNQAAPNIARPIALVALAVAFAAVPLRWKLRIDADGIFRRLLVGWSFWSWYDLSSGRISKRHPYTLYDPARPWWNRKLRLNYMDSDETHEVFTVINTHYQLPPAPDLPDRLTIKYGFRGSATVDHRGIQIADRNMPSDYAWHEVRGLQITRMEPKRRDFVSLQIILPDRELELKLVTHQGGTSPTWRGATPEVINEYLMQKVSADRVEVAISGRPLIGREQIERKLNEVKAAVRNLRIMTAVFSPLLVGCLIWMAVADGVLKAIAIGALMVVYPGSVMIYSYRQQRQKASQLAERLGAAG